MSILGAVVGQVMQTTVIGEIAEACKIMAPVGFSLIALGVGWDMFKRLAVGDTDSPYDLTGQNAAISALALDGYDSLDERYEAEQRAEELEMKGYDLDLIEDEFDIDEIEDWDD